MKYDFDRMVNRYGTDCYKWDMITKRKLDPNTLPLWVADMDFETVPEVKERLKEVADRGIYGYSMLGDGYYDALKNWFSTRFNWQIENDWVIATPGVVFALAAAVRAYTKEGDSVMIQRPVYHPFTNVVKENGRKLVNNPLVMENGKYHMDYEDMERKITEEQVKLFLLCSPHNPVGRVWTKEELTAMGDILVKHHVTVVSDEIHEDFVFRGKHQVFAAIKEEFAQISVTCTAPSKTFNIASMMISNIFIPNRELKAKFRAQLDAAGISQLNVLGLVACEAAYAHGEEWYEAMHSYVADNIAFTKEYVETQLPGVSMVDHEGTYLVWLDFRETGLSVDELEDLIVHRAKLWLDSGKIFGDCGKGFQRVNVACPRATLQEALDRIKTALQESEAQ